MLTPSYKLSVLRVYYFLHNLDCTFAVILRRGQNAPSTTVESLSTRGQLFDVDHNLVSA